MFICFKRDPGLVTVQYYYTVHTNVHAIHNILKKITH